jgi:lysophospholipid acyltransferase (LPLAT)-like uncharacterized protein
VTASANQRLDWKKKFALALAPLLAALLIRSLGATLRYRVIVEPGGFEQTIDSAPGIYCFWHRCLLPAAHMFRGWNIGILISRSFDGELVARTVERMGFRALRGSSSRGGGAALLAAREAFAAGANIAFTADGPRGPRYHAKPGAVRLAQIAGVDHVGAFYLHAENAWQLKSWDGFLIPKPFSSVVVSFARVVPIELNVASKEATQQTASCVDSTRQSVSGVASTHQTASGVASEIGPGFSSDNQADKRAGALAPEGAAKSDDALEYARAQVEAAIERARHAAERGAW